MSYAADGIEPFKTPLLSCSFVIGMRVGGVVAMGVDIGFGYFSWVAATRFVPNFV